MSRPYECDGDEQYTEELIVEKQAELAYDRFCRSQETHDTGEYVEF